MPLPMRIKCTTYKGLVQNTLLSGLEAETLRECDYKRLETVDLTLARKAIGNLGVYTHDDHKRQHSNQHVRRTLGISTVHSELRVRRLKWLHTIHE